MIILDGVCYFTVIQLCRVILSRMVEPYYIQSSIDLLRSFMRRKPWVVLTSLGVYRRPVFPLSPINAPLLIEYYVLHHLSKTLALPSGESVST